MFLGSLDQFCDSVVAASAEALKNLFSNYYEADHTLRWGDYFKFGDPSLLYEAETQAYLYEKAIRDAVGRFVNTACECIPSKFRPPPVSFSTEKSVFTQADPNKGNFLIDAGRIVMLDFEDVNLLPESFFSYKMHGTTDGFVEMVAQYLPWEQSPNLPTMWAARRVLHMHDQPTLGLNEHGYPVRK